MIRLVEILLVVYLFLGMLTGVPELTYVGTGISLIVQLLVVIKLITTDYASVPKRLLILYMINTIIMALVAGNMLNAGGSGVEVLNRTLTLLSIFGLSIVFCVPRIRIKWVLKASLILFTILGLVVIIDALVFTSVGTSIWPPVSYLGNRFVGPFYDPNFLSITYAFIFIVLIYTRLLNGRIRLLSIFVSVSAVLIGGSWSAIVLLGLSLLLSVFVRTKRLGLKQVLIIVVYVLGISAISASIPVIYKTFESTVANFGIQSDEAYVKFLSFEQRIEAQTTAIQGIIDLPSGHGPQSIVEGVGRDTHNSYIGFGYELGLLGVLLILINMRYRKIENDKANDALTTFFFLVALTINIHYSTIFIMMLFLVNTSLSTDVKKGVDQNELGASKSRRRVVT